MNASSLGARLSSAAAIIVCITAGGLAVSATPRPAAAGEWVQTHSDLSADPAVLFGKLANGMRYAIMKNATPKGAVAMRLCIDAGSLQESDAQQGLAHFLEHMAFRGSRHVPEDQVWPGLQRLGMGVGPDANASTGFTQTNYQFNFPHNDNDTIDAGLMRLRDTASELTLAQRAMDDERGPILSEERLRDTPGLRNLKRTLNLLLPGALAPSRIPIGKIDVIQHAPVSLIRDFYNAYYRPERVVLIVVGDIEPKVIETKIKDRFADWTAVGPAGNDPHQTRPSTRAPEADLIVEPGSQSTLALNWVTGYGPDTKAQEQADLIEIMGLKILEYRLQDLANTPQRPFAQTQLGIQHLFHSIYLRSIGVVTRPQDWRKAVDAAVIAVRRIDEYGVTADEVARATNELRAQFQAQAANAAKRPSREVADMLAQSVDEDSVFVSPGDVLSLADEAFNGLTVDKVSAALRRLMRGHGPLLLLSSPTPIDGGKPALAAALAAAEKAPLTAATGEARVVWPYTSFGTPGRVADQTTIADLQTTFVRFANGVRVTVKPTSFATGEVFVAVSIGDGRLGLPSDRDSPIWAVEGEGFALGGLKAIGFDDMSRALAGKIYALKADIADDGLVLLGRTRPTDVVTQLQVLAAYVSAPGWRANAIERARIEQANKLVNASGSPMGVFWRNIPGLLHAGDRRWSAPSLKEIAALEPDGLKDMLAAQLASAPIEVTVVGDITVDAAVQAVAGTFGALPTRPKPTASLRTASAVHFPAGTATPVELHHKGRVDQGVAVVAWPTSDAFDLQTVQDLRVLKDVILTRLTDQLRIHVGATYSPQMMFNPSRAFPGFGYLVAATELPPAKMPLFFTVSGSIAADLRVHVISADELERARKPALETIIAAQQTNAYWVFALIKAQADPRRLSIIRDTVPELKHVTAADVQRAAQTYLSDAKAWNAVIKPEPAGAH